MLGRSLDCFTVIIERTEGLNSFSNKISFTEFRSVNDDKCNCEVRFLTMYFGREMLPKCHEGL